MVVLLLVSIHEPLVLRVNVSEPHFLPPSTPSEHGRWVAGLGRARGLDDHGVELPGALRQVLEHLWAERTEALV